MARRYSAWRTSRVRPSRCRHQPGPGATSAASRRFQVQPGIVRQPRRQHCAAPRATARASNGGSRKTRSKRPCTGDAQPLQRVGLDDLHRASACSRCAGLPQRLRERRIAFDQQRSARASRNGFQAKRAAAGEQVEHPRARQHRRQPVEQGFAHAIGGRPQARRIGHGQARATPAAADDADLAGMSRAGISAGLAHRVSTEGGANMRAILRDGPHDGEFFPPQEA